MSTELRVSLVSLLLVGCSSSMDEHDAGVPDLTPQDASHPDKPDSARPGIQLYETFCSMPLSATYMRCYIDQPPNNGY